ncbi:MAG: DnaA regulatory inactivator Hda [Pseudomonadales bacterium]|nr:DnaA regulatory inactivator Hda [Pseudomonadales bacterium]
MSDMHHPQLPLKLNKRPEVDFSHFIALGNEQLLAQLNSVSIHTLPQWLYVWGAPQCGKSHLLQATCQLAEGAGRSAFYISCNELVDLDPDVLSQLYDIDFVAIDDIQNVLGEPRWEEALFHLYNQLRDSGKSLLVSAVCAPRYLEAGLADLKSRLSAMEIYQVAPLDEDGKRLFLKAAADQRGFALPEEVVVYVLSRADRSLNALQQLIDKLDHQSLQEKRLITVPFVKKVMGW